MVWMSPALDSNSAWTLSLPFQPQARVGFRAGVNLMELDRHVGQDKRVRVLGPHEVAPLFRQVGVVALFVHGEKQFLLLRVKRFLRIGRHADSTRPGS